MYFLPPKVNALRHRCSPAPQPLPRILLQSGLKAAPQSLLIGCSRALASKSNSKPKSVQLGVSFSEWIQIKVNNIIKPILWRREPYLRVSKSLYCICAEYPDHPNEWIRDLKLDDSFFTWYGVTSLHLWLVMQRLRAINEQNVRSNSKDMSPVYIVYGMGQLFQQDIKSRLTDFPTLSRQTQASRKLFNQMYGMNFQYKLAYTDSDLVLAELLWKLVCQSSPNVDAEGLNLLVRYVRANYRHLSALPNADFLDKGLATFLPLVPRQSRDETKLWMKQRLTHAIAPQLLVERKRSE